MTFPLGVVSDISQWVAQVRIQLDPGDALVRHTDGITEAENSSRQLYGIDRLCAVVGAHHGESAPSIRDAIIADLRSHVGGHTVFDDVTLLVLKKR